MSENPEGPGWWIASDGKWYAPELHPSVRGVSPARPETAGSGRTQPHNGQSPVEQGAHIGPQFPDLFQKALQGSHLADNISVKYDGDDERNVPSPATGVRTSSPTNRGTAIGSTVGGAGGGAGAVGSFSGASATKRRWRKGR